VDDQRTSSPPFLRLTADIISAYIGKNAVPAHELPDLIEAVHGALRRSCEQPAQLAPMPPRPAVPIKKSVTPDFLICLEDGKQFRSLKRHLRSHYNLSADEYRAKWGLDADYPMVAPAYARERSQLAKKMGLGQQRRHRMA
jgi:predicted transcriptional regulator